MSHYTVDEVAKKLGLDTQIIENMCKKGTLEGSFQTVKGIWQIPEAIFITTREQDNVTEELFEHLNSKNEENDFYIFHDVVASYYGVPASTVIEWINQRLLSGKRSSQNEDIYLVPREEFEYLKTRREQDNTEEVMQKLLGDDYSEDWDVEIDE